MENSWFTQWPNLAGIWPRLITLAAAYGAPGRSQVVLAWSGARISVHGFSTWAPFLSSEWVWLSGFSAKRGIGAEIPAYWIASHRRHATTKTAPAFCRSHALHEPVEGEDQSVPDSTLIRGRQRLSYWATGGWTKVSSSHARCRLHYHLAWLYQPGSLRSPLVPHSISLTRRKPMVSKPSDGLIRSRQADLSQLAGCEKQPPRATRYPVGVRGPVGSILVESR